MDIVPAPITKSDETVNLFAVINALTLTLSILLIGWRLIGPDIVVPLVGKPIVGKLPAIEIAERIVLLIIFAFVFISVLVGRQILQSQRFVTTVASHWVSVLSASIFAMSLGSITYWESLKGELWFGYGLGFSVLCLAFGIATVALGRVHFSRPSSQVVRTLSFCTGVLGLLLYLPSIIQPPMGIIDLSHSRYILNETLAQVAGVTPLGDFVSQYTSLLGWPLVLIGWLPASTIIYTTVAWLNLLSLLEVYIVWRIARHAWSQVPPGLTLLFSLALVFVKVQPSDTILGSNAASLTFLPGRSLMPMALGLFAIKLSKTSSPHFSRFVLAGAFAVVTIINAPDFGLPAVIAFVLVTILELGKGTGRARALMAQGCGAFVALVLLYGLFATRGFTPQFSYMTAIPRAFALLNAANVSMPVFGLYLAIVSVLVTGFLIGWLGDFSQEERHLRTSLMYGSTWGILTFSYYIGRSVNSNLLLFLFHATFIVFALGNYLTNRLGGHTSMRAALVFLPTLMMVAMPVASLSQPPSPIFEMTRMVGAGPNFSEWSASSISEGSVTYGVKNPERTGSIKELLAVAQRFPNERVGYFGEDGNAIQLLTGLTNVMAVSGRQDLGLPGITSLACQRIDSMQPTVVLVPRDANGATYPLCPQLVNVGFLDSVAIYRVRPVGSDMGHESPSGD